MEEKRNKKKDKFKNKTHYPYSKIKRLFPKQNIRYAVIDSKGNKIEEFRLKSAAQEFVRERESGYFGEKFEVVEI